MSFLGRIPAALRYLAKGATAFDSVPTWKIGQPVYPTRHFENNVQYGYRTNELIYSCIRVKADSAAQIALRVHRKDDDEKLDDHPLRRLLQRPNPFMTEFDLISMILIHLDLAGRSYWEKVRSRAGQVVQLWPLRPDWVRPVIAGGGGVISHYEYHVPGISEPVRLELADVLDFKLHDPMDMYRGLAPVSVAGRVGDVDNASTDFLNLFFKNGSMPMGLLTTKQRLQEPDVERIRARWRERYGGYRNWYDPAVLDQDAMYQKLGLDFKEMAFGELDARSESRTCMTLRVPPILVGAKVGLDRSTFSNYKEARTAFWEDTLIAQYRRISDEIQQDLAPEFGGEIVVQPDYSQVPALQEDVTQRWQRATQALQAGGITVNDFRLQIGLDPVGGSGDVFLRGFNQVAVPVGQADATKVLPFKKNGRQNGYESIHTKEADNAPDDARRREYEEAIGGTMGSFFDGQLQRVQQALRESLSA